MTQVTAPYHFVPLSKWVYMPDWAHIVSHDIPLKDGVSGVLEYDLTNATHLCVGDKKDSNNVLRFARNPEGAPVIPGSSLKGMIRNVLDIASFGKFNQVNDFKLSYRDISSKKGNKSAYLKLLDEAGSTPGWIKYNSKKATWEFTQCKLAKLHHDEIGRQLGLTIKNEETAIKRYSKLPLARKVTATISEQKGVKKNRWAESLGNGQIEGHCIFTNTRILGQGDKSSYNFSYFFYAKQETITSDQIEEQVQNLFNNHRSVEDRVNGVNYNQAEYMMKHAHAEHGIPVFALMMRGKVHSFGFARMPRVSYKNSNYDLINYHSKEHMDDAHFSLSELMFGTLRENGLGLKSRVQFSDATLVSQEDSNISKPVVLGSPKPSFLGAYIEQPEANKYQSYGYDNEKEAAKLSGWKRYHIMREFKENKPPNDNANVQTKLELLAENHTFQGRIAFHNLKREELAALIWVLTLNNSTDYYHSLGHGKPLGAGAVQFDLKITEDFLKSNDGTPVSTVVKNWVQEFTAHMDSQLKHGQWLETPQLKYLLALSDNYTGDEEQFLYNDLKDFQGIKNNFASLDLLSDGNKILSRTERAPEKLGSLSFGKGRLASLFDKDSNHHQEMQRLASDKVVIMDKKRQKAEQAEKARCLVDASPFEKACGELQLIVDAQHTFSSTEQNKAAKQIRNALKAFKVEAENGDFTLERIKFVTDIANNIEIKPSDVSKLIKWLSKQ